jgi:hypothetical protein
MFIICLVKPALINAQLNLAFYNGMPGHWRIRHAISGRSAHTTTRAELLHYFRVQEHKQLNKAKKLQMSMACTKNSNRAERCEKKFAGHFKGKQAEHVNKAGGLSSKTSAPAKHKKSSGSGNRIGLTDKCPIHPDANHVWGDCYQNILNKDNPLKRVKIHPLMR